MTGLPLDRFCRHDELTAALGRLAADHPELVTVSSIGRSHEGRDLWLVTVTDTSTGPHDHKPAHWVDAGIHATELTGTVAALALVDHLIEGYGRGDPVVTHALATRTFYVLPRLNPDGAEAALADRPRHLRSSTRPWPWRDGRRRPGLHEEDVDGDGRILTMRIADPHGAWVPHPDEPRLLVPRPPDAPPGAQPTYRLLAEGVVVDHDGFTVPTPPPPEGIDLNRNWPAGWGTAVRGAGDFPGSEPEVAAVLRAMVDRPNICGANAFHTSGGVILRPSSTRSDRDLPPLDRWTYEQFGVRATELTGYPVHSVFEDFTWDRQEPMAGAADDWAYEHLGVYAWTTEFWDVVHHVTGERSSTLAWYLGPTVEQELAVLRWCDLHFPGRYYGEWRPFEHPQLGSVEIGGWDERGVWGNPPPELLAGEVRPHAAFAVSQALASPRLEVLTLGAEPMGDGRWRVRAGVANTGWLPTQVSEWARRATLVLPAVAELSGPAVIVDDGPAVREIGQLEGRRRFRFQPVARNDGTPDRAVVTWLVRAAPGVEVTVEARHPRAGRARATLTLG